MAEALKSNAIVEELSMYVSFVFGVPLAISIFNIAIIGVYETEPLKAISTSDYPSAKVFHPNILLCKEFEL